MGRSAVKKIRTKKTFYKSILREILSTPSRFLAIVAITALGTGFFFGLKATGPDMKETGRQYFSEQRLMDFRLLSTMGFTQEDIQQLRQRQDVDAVMAGYGFDILVQRQDKEQAVRVHSLPEDTSPGNPDYLNQLIVIEGRLPTAPNECVVDSEQKIEVGETIRVTQSNNTEITDMLKEKEFTVVGRVQSPLYIANQRGNTNIGNGRLHFFIYLPFNAFDSEYYSEVFLSVKGAGTLAFYGGEYKNLITKTTTGLEAFGEQRAEIRYQEILDEANQKLDDARQELADKRAEADAEFADAWQKIVDGEAEIASAKKEINANQVKLDDAAAAIVTGRQQASDGRAELERRQAEFDAGARQLAEKSEAYQAGLDAYNQQRAAFDKANQQLSEMQKAVTGMEQAAAALQNLAGQISAAATPEEAAPLIEAFTAIAKEYITGLQQMAAGLTQAGMAQQAALLQDSATAMQEMLTAGQYDGVAGVAAAVPPQIKPALEGAQAQLDANLPALEQAAAQLAEGKAALEAGAAQMAEGKAALEAGWAQLAGAESQLADAANQLEEGRKKLADARVKLADAQKELAKGKQEYNDKKAEAEEKFAEAEQEIADNQKKIDDLKKPEWFVFDRDKNPGYSGFTSDTDRIKAIAAVIPPFFFIVAALVCLTTMTRMVEEQRTQIGTFKALGFGKRTIAFKFLFYAGAASVAGSVLGVIIGIAIFPSTIWSAYQIMYSMTNLRPANNIGLAIASVGAMVLVNIGATLMACYGELREVPAILMRPKAPKAGQRVFLERIPFIWKRMKFSQKVTIRNLFRYKKRFFMTVIGVAGCTALLLTGFGLRDSITGLISRQFGGINHYNLAGSLLDPSDSTQDTPLNEILPKLGTALYFNQTTIDASNGGENNAGMSTFLYVPEDAQLMNQFVTLLERTSGKAIEFPQGDAVIITEKLAKRLKASVGDTIEINRSGEKAVSVTVGGITENYVYNYVYMAPDTFRSLFGEEPEFTSFIVQMSENSPYSEQEALTKLVDTENVLGVLDIGDLKSNLDGMLESLDSVIWLIIVSAAALAFVVLFNLTNINITERAREIATLKVLGFYNGEVASYVYRENLMLTFIGIAAGLAGGVFLHQFVITTAEIDEVMFRRLVMPLSYLWSILFTLLSALLVNVVMLRRLKKIDMVESLKSAE